MYVLGQKNEECVSNLIKKIQVSLSREYTKLIQTYAYTWNGMFNNGLRQNFKQKNYYSDIIFLYPRQKFFL